MENTQEGLNFLELIFKGGVVMIPIGLLSVVTIYLIIERFIYIKNASKLEVSIATVALSMATFTESVCEKPNAVKNKMYKNLFI
jgi:hypothetical protein